MSLRIDVIVFGMSVLTKTYAIRFNYLYDYMVPVKHTMSSRTALNLKVYYSAGISAISCKNLQVML